MQVLLGPYKHAQLLLSQVLSSDTLCQAWKVGMSMTCSKGLTTSATSRDDGHSTCSAFYVAEHMHQAN